MAPPPKRLRLQSQPNPRPKISLKKTVSVEKPPHPIYASLSALFLNDKYSDMTITCCGEEFKAHRVIVCSQSKFFD
ncbi:BTB/POZ domain-containing protein, partial [Bacillus thuringiensis]|nr:BTB/POZ domain-containing protein [Bacillus thuringiensis]